MMMEVFYGVLVFLWGNPNPLKNKHFSVVTSKTIRSSSWCHATGSSVIFLSVCFEEVIIFDSNYLHSHFNNNCFSILWFLHCSMFLAYLLCLEQDRFELI